MLNPNQLAMDLSAARRVAHVFADHFMVPDIRNGFGLRVECADGSSEILPDVVIGVFGRAVGEELTDEEVAQLADFVGETPESATVISGWFGRMSAPGYLDCTSWEFGETYAEVAESLIAANSDE